MKSDLPLIRDILNPNKTTPGFFKAPEGLQLGVGDGSVPVNLLAAWNQAVNYRITVMMAHAFGQTWLNSCRERKETATLLRTFILTSWRYPSLTERPHALRESKTLIRGGLEIYAYTIQPDFLSTTNPILYGRNSCQLCTLRRQ